jgi:hypothetical protein
MREFLRHRLLQHEFVALQVVVDGRLSKVIARLQRRHQLLLLVQGRLFLRLARLLLDQ